MGEDYEVDLSDPVRCFDNISAAEYDQCVRNYRDYMSEKFFEEKKEICTDGIRDW